MKKSLLMLIMSSTLAVTGAFAAAEKSSGDIDAKLAAARAKLEAAAREVAQLSAEAGDPVVGRFLPGEMQRRAIIGVQLDPGGKDGAKVTGVSPGGPAAEAGVQAGDVIVGVNGKAIKGDSSAREVVRLMGQVEPESKVNLRVLRDGKPRDIVVVARPMVSVFSGEVMPPMAPPIPFERGGMVEPPMSFSRSFGAEFDDMELVTLTPQLGKYFGTNEGVLVVRKPEGNGFKLEDGDVILAIDGRKPTGGAHATRILRSYQPGEKINIRVMRDHKVANIEASMPTDEHAGRRFRTQGFAGPDQES